MAKREEMSSKRSCSVMSFVFCVWAKEKAGEKNNPPKRIPIIKRKAPSDFIGVIIQ
jgi:hypothetical protein